MSLLRMLRRRYNDERIDPDVLYHVLSNERRRAVLQYLLAQELQQPIPIRELVYHLSEQGIERDSAYVSLYQVHLPKLEDTGMIDYNSDRGLVSLTSRGVMTITAHKQLSPVLDHDRY